MLKQGTQVKFKWGPGAKAKLNQADGYEAHGDIWAHIPGPNHAGVSNTYIVSLTSGTNCYGMPVERGRQACIHADALTVVEIAHA